MDDLISRLKEYAGFLEGKVSEYYTAFEEDESHSQYESLAVSITYGKALEQLYERFPEVKED